MVITKAPFLEILFLDRYHMWWYFLGDIQYKGR